MQQPKQPLGQFVSDQNHIAAKLTDKICFWSLPDFEEQFLFDKEEWIGSYLLHEGHLVIGTDWAFDLGEPCQIDVWRLSDLNRITTFGKFEDETWAFHLKLYHDPKTDKVYQAPFFSPEANPRSQH
ncbi:MAG: hypothetical protein ACFFFG_18280 [Candidatus Thorarchaeota archaeon]